MVWKQPRPETPETARSESSRDPETQKLHGLKAAETRNPRNCKVWKQSRPRNPEAAWSESSRDQKTQKLHGLKAAETKKTQKFITLQNLELKIDWKLKVIQFKNIHIIVIKIKELVKEFKSNLIDS